MNIGSTGDRGFESVYTKDHKNSAVKIRVMYCITLRNKFDKHHFPAPEHLATAASLGGAGSHGLHRASCAEASQEKQACHDDQGEMTQSPSCRCPRKASSTMSPRAEQSRIAAAIIATGFTVGWQRADYLGR
jgi:hypothetical protein